MQSALYDAVAFGMRYWFLVLIALMLFALVAVSISEYKRHKKVMNKVTRFIGYMEIIDGDESSLGLKLGLDKKTVIGSGKNADIIIEDALVLRTHAVIEQIGPSFFVTPALGASVILNGAVKKETSVIKSGDILSFGSVKAAVHFKGDGHA